MRHEIFDICINDEIISKLFWCREVLRYGDNGAGATLAIDDEHVKLHAHKGINSDTLACAVEDSVIIDVTLASMNRRHTKLFLDSKPIHEKHHQLC